MHPSPERAPSSPGSPRSDFDWYSFLSARGPLEEVNFWQPSGGGRFAALAQGAPFFFRVKSPYNAIAGFGYFARRVVAPAWHAWECFGERNGAPDFATMVRRIARYRRDDAIDLQGRYAIGCLMISLPVFFSRDQWVAEPAGWAPNIVQGRTVDLAQDDGARLLRECLERRWADAPPEVPLGDSEHADRPRYGDTVPTRPRLGQGTFKLAVLDAYGGACAVTTEHSLPVLEAAHIQPFSSGGLHDVRNGLLLRTDIHRLFDRGYVTVTPSGEFRVSRRLRDDWENGRTYYELADRIVDLPPDRNDRPDRDLLTWHNDEVFQG